MALTMIDPTSIWLEVEVVELPTITRVTTKKVNGKERTIEEEIFDKSSDRISRLVDKIWLCRCWSPNWNEPHIGMGIAFFCFFQSRTRSAFSHQKFRQSQRHGAPLITKI